ncbi:MAG: hypothetical protein OHK93_006902 [Ramalina farinacea]|uniref:Heterokaryon incompatibility domain-containing protein n=1 Tax=Ramalina farinacea TaxID=258253 RepID=A0AA43QJG7_9LECA|nr:hypothetical protein [Ramalina farinacea]
MTIKPWSGKKNDEEPVCVHLEQFPVLKCPRYQALSYTWGQPRRSDRVLVDDKFYISITPNLLRALLQLRRKKPVTIWIDAICINQEDIQERSSQVRIMAKIYYEAKEIIVWIDSGAQSESSDDAPWVIILPHSSLGEGEKRALEQGETRIVELPRYALEMFRQTWFTRIWILQEIAYARKITIYFGTEKIEWDEAIKWVEYYVDRSLDIRNTPTDEPVRFGIAMTYTMHSWRNRVQNGLFNLPLSECIHQSKRCESSDPKDKIFALLSIARDVSHHFEIDYNWSEAEICSRLTQHTIDQRNRLDILRCIGTRRTLRDTHSFPSWVPSLFGESRCDPLPSYDAWSTGSTDSGDQKLAVAPLCDSTYLVVKCLQVLDIIQISPVRIGGFSTLHAMLTVFQQWYAAVCAHPRYFPSSSEPEVIKYRLNCFWGAMTMTLGGDAIKKHIHNPYITGEGWDWPFRKIYHKSVGDSQPEDEWASGPELFLEESEIFDPDKGHLYSSWAQKSIFPPQEFSDLRERAFGFASNGPIVLLPAEARVGDHICLLYGIQLPFVLRKGENEGFRVVGACYLHEKIDWDTFEEMETLEQVPYIYLE